MKDLIIGVLMMAGAVMGMFLFIAGITIALASPLIIIVWLLIQALT